MKEWIELCASVGIDEERAKKVAVKNAGRDVCGWHIHARIVSGETKKLFLGRGYACIVSSSVEDALYKILAEAIRKGVFDE